MSPKQKKSTVGLEKTQPQKTHTYNTRMNPRLREEQPVCASETPANNTQIALPTCEEQPVCASKTSVQNSRTALPTCEEQPVSENEVHCSSEALSKSETRIPLCLCIEKSGSMCGRRIDLLNNALGEFYITLKSNSRLSNIDLAIVTYSAEPTVLKSFSDKPDSLPVFKAEGGAFIDEGLYRSVEIINEQISFYKRTKVPFASPLLFILTDSVRIITGSEVFVEDKCIIKQLEKSYGISVFSIGMRKTADMNSLKEISAKSIMLHDDHFGEFTKWLENFLCKKSTDVSSWGAEIY